MSNEIKVDTLKIDDYVSRLQGLINSVNTLDNNLTSYANQQGYNGISWTLQSQGSPNDFVWRLKKNVDYLQKVSSKINSVESTLRDIDPLTYNGDWFGDFVDSWNSAVDWARDALDDVADFVSEFGYLGEGVSVVIGVITGKSTLEDFFGLAGNFVSMLGDLVYCIGKVGDKAATWAQQLGLDEWVENISNKAGNMFNSVAGWVGKGLGALGTLAENFKENGGWNLRTIAETVGEFVVDLVIDKALVSIATAASIAIIGGVAPAPLIAAAVVMGKIVADAVCEYTTGKDFTEFVSDFIIGGIKATGDCIMNTGRAIGSSLEVVGEIVTEGDVVGAVVDAGRDIEHAVQDGGVAVWDKAMEEALAK